MSTLNPINNIILKYDEYYLNNLFNKQPNLVNRILSLPAEYFGLAQIHRAKEQMKKGGDNHSRRFDTKKYEVNDKKTKQDSSYRLADKNSKRGYGVINGGAHDPLCL